MSSVRVTGVPTLAKVAGVVAELKECCGGFVSQRQVAKRMKRFGSTGRSFYQALNELVSKGIIKRQGTKGSYLYGV